ncbi:MULTISPECIES: hypothetical protein [Haloarcula]|nr:MULTISPECIES: hypothetical protein [Halomicroarcula]MBX0349633.1 hypothetical protein [Halomicroarcula pellucida]MDS0278783.1 hypothetical protein [Halomicroarcula sp. S1AR25-4]
MSRDWEPETIFEVLGSEAVRRILAVDPVSVPVRRRPRVVLVPVPGVQQ